ncbi:MAG: hypothetical protein ACI9OJ_004794, partial [Myxococcota bacterium]
FDKRLLEIGQELLLDVQLELRCRLPHCDVELIETRLLIEAHFGSLMGRTGEEAAQDKLPTGDARRPGE